MYEIRFTPEAIDDLESLKKAEQKEVLDGIETQLKHEPSVETRNRKRLRPNDLAEWELRIGKFRVFYDVEEQVKIVKVEAIGYDDFNREIELTHRFPSAIPDWQVFRLARAAVRARIWAKPAKSPVEYLPIPKAETVPREIGVSRASLGRKSTRSPSRSSRRGACAPRKELGKNLELNSTWERSLIHPSPAEFCRYPLSLPASLLHHQIIQTPPVQKHPRK